MLVSLALVVLSKKFIYGSVLGLALIAVAVDPMILSAAAVVVISAIAAAAVTVIKALGAVKTELLEKQAEILKQGAVTQGHVDGMTTAAAAKRTADENTILSLRQQLSDAENRAAMLAQSTATVAVLTPIAATVEITKP